MQDTETQPVIVSEIAEEAWAIQSSARSSSSLRRGLLFCGIIAVPLYAATDIFAGTYTGYSFADQAVSELFAIGAQTSGFVVPLFTLYSLLVLAFAFGVWMVAGCNPLYIRVWKIFLAMIELNTVRI